MSNYPELQVIVDKLVDSTIKSIKNEVKSVESMMPYKEQWVLEELIAKLTDYV